VLTGVCQAIRMFPPANMLSKNMFEKGAGRKGKNPRLHPDSLISYSHPIYA